MDEQFNLKEYCLDVAQRAKNASRVLAAVSATNKNNWMTLCADLLLERQEEILAANRLDLDAARAAGLSPAMIDRLTLSEKTLREMGVALREIAAFPEPIGSVISSNVRPGGFQVQKVRAPIGVVFFTYESRPNVTTDAAAICVKSGNAVILRGGKEAFHSNQALGKILADAALQAGLPADAVQLLQTTDRNAIDEFLQMPQFIDVAIPRGGYALIKRVSEMAKMPVIKHFAGNCHVYIDKSADLDLAVKVLLNSKCQRLGTCNTAESLIVHREIAETALPKLLGALIEQGVEVRADQIARDIVKDKFDLTPATEEDYYTEFLAKVISVKVVESVQNAIEDINKYSSGHTEAIIAQDINAINAFVASVDSAAIMVNSSTRLHDGGQFGLGAEIGISTDKFHARGPCGVYELTSYKYVVYSDGAIRQ